MAPTQKKAPQRRSPKPGWLLCCFGFPLESSPSEGKKARKSGGRKRWFKLCLSKIRVVNVRRKQVSLEAKTAALKATESIMLEASKLKLLPEGNEALQHNCEVQKDQSDDATCYQEDYKSKTKHTSTLNVSKDSVIGLSIMLTTLVIMGIWGKLCAILCMSAWFYCVPLLRMARDFNDVPGENDKRLHLASKLDTKKVVLQ
ncbi:hypothetical protein Cgig2_002659 [Carnegiea gigantea]|uniref:Uncharacterized protein n=1 Tax=Carnegiea gigantea TaxID=171969 RepID=A0A9Q1GPX8_9CARY|nr:hypothetical protein Cgig2_002659 [Carnegiea gigantea]